MRKQQVEEPLYYCFSSLSSDLLSLAIDLSASFSRNTKTGSLHCLFAGKGVASLSPLSSGSVELDGGVVELDAEAIRTGG